MSDEVKHSMIWGIALTIVLSSLCWSIAWYWTTTTRAAIESGYSEQTLPGSTGSHWVKPVDGEKR